MPFSTWVINRPEKIDDSIPQAAARMLFSADRRKPRLRFFQPTSSDVTFHTPMIGLFTLSKHRFSTKSTKYDQKDRASLMHGCDIDRPNCRAALELQTSSCNVHFCVRTNAFFIKIILLPQISLTTKTFILIQHGKFAVILAAADGAHRSRSFIITSRSRRRSL